MGAHEHRHAIEVSATRAPGPAAEHDLELALAELGRTQAPATLLPAVLRRVGLVYRYAVASSPLGPVFVGYGPQGIAAVRLVADGSDSFELWFRGEVGATVRPESELPASVAEAFEARIQGRRSGMDVDLGGRTPFQREVLRAAATIPHGQVRSYGWLAREIGHPGSVRAVGTALANNPVPLAIPCHRVVPADLHLGRYSCGGPSAKRVALQWEGLDVDRLERLADAGIRYVGSDSTHVFCTPACSDAVRITPRHLVRFATEGQARSDGYRPCKVCRPVAEAA